MNLNEYQEISMRTCNDDHDRLSEAAFGLIGESGEIVDVIKKWRFQSGTNAPVPRNAFVEEIGDVMWYLAELATAIGKKLDEMIIKNGKNEMNYVDIEDAAVMAVDWSLLIYSVCKNARFAAIHRHMQFVYNAMLYICKQIDATIDEVLEVNIAKRQARYPDGFDPERSLHREVAT